MNKPKLYVGAEGSTWWKYGTLNPLFLAAFPDYEIILDLENRHPNLIIRTFDAKEEVSNVPYICWSGECYPVPYRKNGQLPLCEINVFNVKRPVPSIYLPYGLELWYDKDRYLEKIALPDFDRPYILAYMASNSVCLRQLLFKKFKEVFKDNAHSLGRCQREIELNKDWDSSGYENNNKIFSKYKFVLAAENSDVDWYITEKFFQAYTSGAIPIFWGTHHIKEVFNPNCFIYVKDFPTIDHLIKRVEEINNDKNLYMKIATAPIYANGKRHPYFNYYPNSKTSKKNGDILRKIYDNYIKHKDFV